MRTPVSTYRLQITAGFDLSAAARTLTYLHDLGVDWVYLSPLLEAEPGSDHGYDVVAHDRVDPARGGAEGLAQLSAEARRLGMGVLVDIVPNHVGVATPQVNAWWWDLLTHGRSSRHAAAFDVDWDLGGGRVRIPVVGDDDGSAIEIDPVAGVWCGTTTTPTHWLPGTTTLEEQHYELVSWRLADHGLNYRRFFAVNTLAGIRVEDPAVFDASHVEIGRWFDEGLVDGLRVDHPDGLRDPAAYLDDLAQLTGGAYVLVEKILEPGEALEPGVGDRRHHRVRRPRPDRPGAHRPGRAGAADRARRAAARRARRLARADPRHQAGGGRRDPGLGGAPGGARARSAGPRRSRAPARDDDARRRRRGAGGLLPGVPLLPPGRPRAPRRGVRGCPPAPARPRRRPSTSSPRSWATRRNPAALRFQQTSGAVMAKGVEDCAFYRTSRLTSLTEVGGDPSEFSLAVDEFHAAHGRRQRDWPLAMTTTSTHDTKRGEDVRARITVLAELPEVWAEALDRLLSLAPLPDPGFGNLLWQAVVGAWPASRERLHAYAEKAMREAGDRTTWSRAGRDVRAGRARGRRRGVRRRRGREPSLDDLVARVAGPGWSNALSAKLVALTMPGIPDVYQGSELWEQSLVDPDNRRPVDFDARRGVLARVLGGERPVLTPSVDDPGHAKLLVTQAALTLRRHQPHRFTTYAPVTAERRGGRAPARLRPWRRPHCRHPAARGSGRARLGRHGGASPGRVGGPTCSPGVSTPGPRRHASCWRTSPVALAGSRRRSR